MKLGDGYTMLREIMRKYNRREYTKNIRMSKKGQPLRTAVADKPRL